MKSRKEIIQGIITNDPGIIPARDNIIAFIEKTIAEALLEGKQAIEVTTTSIPPIVATLVKADIKISTNYLLQTFDRLDDDRYFIKMVI